MYQLSPTTPIESIRIKALYGKTSSIFLFYPSGSSFTYNRWKSHTMISKEKRDELEQRMLLLKIYEEDLIEKFILGSGSGGQKINKTSSCVYLKHIPSGIEVKCQKVRSRDQNRFYARRELCNKIEEKDLEIVSKKEQAREKIRRQKKRRTRRSQEKVLDDKRTHSKTKSLRQKPKED
jgi:peptide chain release factor